MILGNISEELTRKLTLSEPVVIVAPVEKNSTKSQLFTN
jgi:hypothetical protein